MAVASNLSATTLMAAGNSTEDTKVMPPDPIQQLMRHADFRTTEKHYPVRHHPGGCRPDPRNTVDCDSKCAPEQDTDRRKFVRPAGFEVSLNFSGKNRFFQQGGTGGGDIDSQLRTLIRLWPTLSQSTRAQILAFVQAK